MGLWGGGLSCVAQDQLLGAHQLHISGHSHATCIQPHGARNMATLVAPIPPYGYIRMHKGVWARSARSQVCNWRPDQKKVFSRHFQLSDMDRTQ